MTPQDDLQEQLDGLEFADRVSIDRILDNGVIEYRSVSGRPIMDAPIARLVNGRVRLDPPFLPPVL